MSYSALRVLLIGVLSCRLYRRLRFIRTVIFMMVLILLQWRANLSKSHVHVLLVYVGTDLDFKEVPTTNKLKFGLCQARVGGGVLHMAQNTFVKRWLNVLLMLDDIDFAMLKHSSGAPHLLRT